jgi:hypothetical protein
MKGVKKVWDGVSSWVIYKSVYLYSNKLKCKISSLRASIFVDTELNDCPATFQQPAF